MKDYTRLTRQSVDNFKYCLKDHKAKIGEFNDYDAFFDYSMAVKRLGELEDKIESGEIDYVADRDKEISRLTAENERLQTENAKIDEYRCVIDDISEQCRELEAENAELRATLSKMETVEKELRERLGKAVELPVNAGDIIWAVLGGTIIEPRKVKSIMIYKTYYFIDVSDDGENDARGFFDEQFRVVWFTDYAEAEARLKEIQEENDD